MADFVLLYSGGSMPETDEDKARVMKAWDGWYSELGGAIKDGGNPFAPAAKVSGSPFTGYTILQADSLDSATSLAKSSPVLQGGGSVTVYEAFDVM
jgi:hypothetical protein